MRIKVKGKNKNKSSFIRLIQSGVSLLVIFLIFAIRPLFQQPRIEESPFHNNNNNGGGDDKKNDKKEGQNALRKNNNDNNNNKNDVLLSRDPDVKISTDVRGNLGPPEVMIQKNPGNDWLKDRWQAASDMHGTSIPGVHWVLLEFPNSGVRVSKIVLDWEAAYASDYKIEVATQQQQHQDELASSSWQVLFDSEIDSSNRISEEYGQSPGVKTKTPLHVVHTITVPQAEQEAQLYDTKFLRLYIRKSAMGWGVSLWQADVYGST